MSIRDVSEAEARGCVEMFKAGGSFVAGVTHWDGKQIGNGEPGEVTLAIAKLYGQDVRKGLGFRV